VLDRDRNLVANFTEAPPPVPIPTISISSAPAVVNEGRAAVFTISATTVNPTFAVFVDYAVSGKAENGLDYTLSGVSRQIMIPPGESSVTVTLNALADNLLEKKEKVVVTLRPGSGYKLSRKKRVTLTIADVPSVATSAIMPAP
jgi:hypothetical protein